MPFVYFVVAALIIGLVVFVIMIGLIVVVLSIAPAITALIGFFVGLPIWITTYLSKNAAVQEAIELRLSSNQQLVWSLNSEKISDHWPYGVLFASGGIGVAVAVIELLIVQTNERAIVQSYGIDGPVFFQLAAWIVIIVAPFAPFVIARMCEAQIKSNVKERLTNHISGLVSHEAALLAKIVQAESHLIENYNSMGISRASRNIDAARNAVVMEARGKNSNARDALEENLLKLEAEAKSLAECRLAMASTRRTFDDAKAAIIHSGSRTLLEELDRINEGFNSEALLGLIADQKWRDVHEVLRLMAGDLGLLKAAAERGEQAPVQSGPTNDEDLVISSDSLIDEICQVLGVTPDWPTNAIETHVKALRMRWYVDHGSNEQDKKIRNARLKNINAAWDEIRKRRASA
jgi:hypothetical protein